MREAFRSLRPQVGRLTRLAALQSGVWLAGYLCFLGVFYGESMKSPGGFDFSAPLGASVWAALCGGWVFFVVGKRRFGHSSVAGFILGAVVAPPLAGALPALSLPEAYAWIWEPALITALMFLGGWSGLVMTALVRGLDDAT